jgi:cell division protein FtsL
MRLTLALMLRRASATVTAGPLAGIAGKALLRVGIGVLVGHMALLLFASIVVISRDHTQRLLIEIETVPVNQ